MWVPHHLEQRPRRRQSGVIAPCKGTTRRRHAAKGLRMAQNPHRHQPEVRRVASKTGAGPLGAKILAQHDPSGDSSAKKLAQHAQKTPNLGQFERTGRTFSRFHDDTAPQGELFRACRRRPSSALPISDLAPPVWRAPEAPEGLEGTGGLRGAGPGRGTGRRRAAATAHAPDKLRT